MPKFFNLSKTKANVTKEDNNKFNLSKFKNINIKFVFFCLIITFGIGYLLVANNTAIKGFKVKELENKVSDLKQQNMKLELETIKLQSVGEIEKKIGQLSMVKIAKTEYLSGTGSSVALAGN